MKKFLIYDLILLLILIIIFIGILTDTILLQIAVMLYMSIGGYIALFALTVILMVFVKELLNNGFNKQNMFYYGSAITMSIIFAILSFVIPFIPSI